MSFSATAVPFVPDHWIVESSPAMAGPFTTYGSFAGSTVIFTGVPPNAYYRITGYAGNGAQATFTSNVQFVPF